MGAAASVTQLCTQAFQWFRNYIDTEMYITDFELIDKDSDGSISYVELCNWIEANAKKDPAWNVFNKNKNVLAIAHKSASVSAMGRQHANMRPEKIVDIIDFRTLLVELFVTSILWSYFITADNYEEGNDVGNKQLNLDEFRVACLTLTSAYARESLSNEQIETDFNNLDTNCNGSIGFVEICNYCSGHLANLLTDTHSALYASVNGHDESKKNGSSKSPKFRISGNPLAAATAAATTLISPRTAAVTTAAATSTAAHVLARGHENIASTRKVQVVLLDSSEGSKPDFIAALGDGASHHQHHHATDGGNYISPVMDAIEDVNSHVIANANDSVDDKNKSAIHALVDIVKDQEDKAVQLRDSGDI